MNKSNIPAIDCRSGKIRHSICPDAIVTLSSQVQNWQGLKVEQQYYPPSETPEMVSISHLICVHLSAPQWIEYREDGKAKNCYMKPGDIFIVPDRSSHSARWQKDAECIILALEPDLISKFAPEAVKGTNIELIPCKGQKDGLIENIALAFKEELETDGSGGQLYRDCLTNALIARLLRKYSVCSAKEELSHKGLGKGKLQQVLDYIEAHLTEEIKLTEIAAVAGLSQYHFARLFKESVGISPNRYVNRCRIEKAKQLLNQQQQTVSNVAKVCGFSNSSYFIKQFRQITGVTPKVYQERV